MRLERSARPGATQPPTQPVAGNGCEDSAMMGEHEGAVWPTTMKRQIPSPSRLVWKRIEGSPSFSADGAQAVDVVLPLPRFKEQTQPVISRPTPLLCAGHNDGRDIVRPRSEIYKPGQALSGTHVSVVRRQVEWPGACAIDG